MAIQLRRGLSTDYDASKMLQGEAAIFTDTDEMVFKGTNSVKLLGTNSQSLSSTEQNNVCGNINAMPKTGGTFSGNVVVSVPSADTSLGRSYFALGNSTAEGTVGNSRGLLQIYGSGAYKTSINAPNSTADRTITCPDASGTFALAGDYLYSGKFSISNGSSGYVILDIPKNFQGLLMTVPLTSNIDAWGLYGLSSQSQSSNWYKYYKTLISCGEIAFSYDGSQSVQVANDIKITNSGLYAVATLWWGNQKLGIK